MSADVPEELKLNADNIFDKFDAQEVPSEEDELKMEETLLEQRVLEELRSGGGFTSTFDAIRENQRRQLEVIKNNRERYLKGPPE